MSQQELQRQREQETIDTGEDDTDSLGLQMLFADEEAQPSSPLTPEEVVQPAPLLGDAQQIQSKVQQGVNKGKQGER